MRPLGYDMIMQERTRCLCSIYMLDMHLVYKGAPFINQELDLCYYLIVCLHYMSYGG